jgi:hypothetical protein
MQGRSSSLVGYGIGIAEVVGSNPTRSKPFAYLIITNLYTKNLLNFEGYLSFMYNLVNSKYRFGF